MKRTIDLGTNGNGYRAKIEITHRLDWRSLVR